VIVPDFLASLAADDSAIIVAIVAARLLIPLLIPRFPLVIIAALVLDGIDNSLLAQFTDLDLTADGPYQSWDKALDIYYLAIAYLATMRNWTSDAAFRICQFLFYYRLVGVVLFELLDSRSMLLIFPNTFEYFFIAYELIRLRFDPTRVSARFWLVAAVVLWVFVKLPQEYWIHIAQRDMTHTIVENPIVGVALALVAVAALALLLFVVRPTLGAPAWGWRFAADPLPTSPGDAHRRHAERLRRGRVVWGEVLEKAVLLALLCIIFASILPNVGASPLQVTIGIALIVAANAAISMGFVLRTHVGLASATARFGALVGINLVLVFVANLVLADDDDFQFGSGLFFAFLITLIIWLYDVYKPAYDARFERSPLGVTSVGDLLRRVRLAAP
jgi:hypothetical protein